MKSIDRNKEYLKKLDIHLISTKENTHYALKRLDIMVISLSSGGIYLNLEIHSFLYEKVILDFASFWIAIPSLIFSLSIILNLISQWTGFRANKNEEGWIELEIENSKRNKSKSKLQAKQLEIDCKINFHNKLTSIFNGLSSVILILGIIYLAILSLIIF